MTWPTPTPGVPPTESQIAVERLMQAERALHDLQIGRLSTEVEDDGRRVRYQRTDIDKLQGYIDTLKSRIAGERPRYGAIGVIL